MSILIKGMDLPKEGFVEILIRDDGTVLHTGQSYRIGGTDYYTPYVGEMPAISKAVPVPPHGDLIDRDALVKEGEDIHETDGYESVWGFSYDMIRNAPTIIQAEEGE